jgi:hypothetical protein
MRLDMQYIYIYIYIYIYVYENDKSEGNIVYSRSPKVINKKSIPELEFKALVWMIRDIKDHTENERIPNKTT